MKSPVFATPDEAEQAFYQAFEAADLNAMMQVWDSGEHIECIHPLGPRLRGVAAVMRSWRAIFDEDAGVKVQLAERRRTLAAHLAVHVVEELLRFGQESRSRVFATNIYQLTPGGWKMVLHHASPAPRRASAAVGTPPSLH